MTCAIVEGLVLIPPAVRNRPNRRPSPDRATAALLAEAVRLLAGGEAADIDSARRKAAAHLGLRSSGPESPGDDEIRAGLAAYLDLFGRGRHKQRRHRMLHAATDAMRFLANFEPMLLLDSIDEARDDSASVELLVFCDDPDALPRWLDEQGIRYDTRRLRLRAADQGEQTRIEVDAPGFAAGDTGFVLLPLPPSWRRRGIVRHGNQEAARRLTSNELDRLLQIESV